MSTDKKRKDLALPLSVFICVNLWLIPLSFLHAAEPIDHFGGRQWNISTGNLSVTYIQHSPIGAHPLPDYYEPLPTLDSQKIMKGHGLIANEDYIAWGAVEREAGKWDWSQHDKTCELMHQAGLKYVVYDWVHFPPMWLRDDPKQCTLMKCLEHNQNTNYLSIFDPRTIQWYDHFYKSLHEHFGEKIDNVYACILGPYGEGNYPLLVPDWVNIGHCHEGYWCGDEFAIKAFRAAMQGKYGSIDALNAAWQTTLANFDAVTPPAEITEKFKPAPDAFNTPGNRQRWIDFISWYHQAIIDFADQSIQTVMKYFPKEKIRTKPGGNAGGVNPIAWGTYCPGYAKMAGKYGIPLQPADCQGAVFGDKWVGTAYQFYHVPLGTEPAGGLDSKHFVRRMFSDASCGASQLFTYEFEQHVGDIQKYVHLYEGRGGDTEIAVYCPTTLYRLGGDLKPTIQSCDQLRDLCEFDVLDELLITDGALTPAKYKALIIFQGDFVEQPILDKLSAYVAGGGRLMLANQNIKNLAGAVWPGVNPNASVQVLSANWLAELQSSLAGLKGYEGALDGVWTCRRDDQVILYNTTDKNVPVNIMDGPRIRAGVNIAPGEIFSTR
jgi:hypothetical protein